MASNEGLDSSGEVCRRFRGLGGTLPCLLLPIKCILFCFICVCIWTRERVQPLYRETNTVLWTRVAVAAMTPRKWQLHVGIAAVPQGQDASKVLDAQSSLFRS